MFISSIVSASKEFGTLLDVGKMVDKFLDQTKYPHKYYREDRDVIIIEAAREAYKLCFGETEYPDMLKYFHETLDEENLKRW